MAAKKTAPAKTQPEPKKDIKIYTAAKRKAVATPATNQTASGIALATLTVDQFVKAVAETVLSANAAQSNQISSQIAQQVSKQISEQISSSIGKTSSDLQSRAIVQSDVDVNSEERIRSSAAREDALIGYKSNVTDFLIGTDAVNTQRNSTSALSRMVEASVNHYATTLSDERIHKASLLNAQHRHTDIAVENQWESGQEALVDAIVGEVLKSIQVPPAATEYAAKAAAAALRAK